jgi:hypothetical protein
MAHPLSGSLITFLKFWVRLLRKSLRPVRGLFVSTTAKLPSARLWAYWLRIPERAPVKKPVEGDVFVLFSGMSGGVGGLPTRTIRASIAQEFPQAPIYIRNLDFLAWNRVAGFHHWEIDQSTRILNELGERYSRVYLVGWSAGGFAAILAGSLAGVDGVLAYSAQSERSHRPEKLYGPYSDVREYISVKTPIFAYFEPEGVNEHSPYQSHRMSDFPGVKVRSVRGRNFSEHFSTGGFAANLREMVEAS